MYIGILAFFKSDEKKLSKRQTEALMKEFFQFNSFELIRLCQQRDLVGGVRKMAIFADVQYYL